MGKSYQILLVEDDESDIELIQSELNKLSVDANLLVICKKEELLEYLEDASPHLIICDYNLSEFTGMDALHLVREQYPDLPFILVSECIGEEKAVDIMLEGASGYARKENPERLRAIVERELRKYDRHLQDKQELKQTKQRLQSIIDSVDGIAWEADAHTFEFTFISSQAEQLLGYSPKEWVNTPYFWQEHIHPGDRENVLSYCHHKTQQGENHEFEYRMLDSSGKYVWLRNYVTVTAQKGEPDQLLGIMIDITEQKMVEKQRDKAYQIADIGHWELDLINEELHWSDAIYKLHEVDLDYNPEPDTAIEFFKEGKDRQKIREVVEHAIETGDSFEVELRLITAKGNQRWIRTIGEAELCNGECERIFGSIQDITDRKVTEQKLRDVVEHSTNMFYRHDTNHVLSYVSPQAVEFLECSPNEARKQWTEFATDHPVNKKGLEATQKAIDTGKTQPAFPLQLRKSTGEKIWVRVNEAPITENGKTVAIVGSLTDITEQKKLQNLLHRTNRLAKIGSWEIDFSENEEGEVYWSEMIREMLEVGEDFQPTVEDSLNFCEPESREQARKSFEAAVSNGTDYDNELLMRTGKGNKRWIRNIGHADFKDGECVRVYGSFQDITERKKYEEKLEELALVASKTTDVIFMVDPDERITWVNNAFEKVLGYQFDEVVGKSPGNVLGGPDNKQQTMERISSAFKKQESQQVTVLNYAKDGNKYWFDLTLDPIFDANGSCEGFIGIQKDVTEQMKQQKELRESVDRYESVSKATSDTIWDLDLESDTIQYNQNIYNMFGYDNQQVKNVADWWRNNIHPDDRPGVLEKIDNALRSSSDRFQLEYRFQTADGSYKHIYDRAFIVEDQEGNPIRLIGAMQDITQQREEQKWLQLFESAIATTTESVAIIEAKHTGSDERRRIKYVNEAFSEMTGYSKQEAIGKTLKLLIGPDTDPEKIQTLYERMNDWKTSEVELMNYKKNGDPFWILVSMAPVKDSEGSYSHWVCVGRDVSNRRKREQQLKHSLEEKETLLLEIHHRVKNNLAVVSGMMQLQAFGEENKEIKEKLFDSVARIQTMGSIHELLYKSESFSSLQFDENIKKLVKNITKTLQTDIELDIKYNTTPMCLNINQAIPCSLIVNEVITNIIKHAFPKRNCGEIYVSAYEEEDNVFISIMDNGIGLPSDFGKRSDSLGLQLIDTLSSQLEAKYNYRSVSEGAEFNLYFEKAEVKGIGSIYL